MNLQVQYNFGKSLSDWRLLKNDSAPWRQSLYNIQSRGYHRTVNFKIFGIFWDIFVQKFDWKEWGTDQKSPFNRSIYELWTSRIRIILWHVDPLLGKNSVSTFQRQRIRRQQSDTFRCYATRCNYNTRGRGDFYVVRIYPLLGNACVFCGTSSRLYKWYRTESNRIVERESEWSESSAVKKERFGWRFVMIYCSLL
jgi:hypothetical protein